MSKNDALKITGTSFDPLDARNRWIRSGRHAPVCLAIIIICTAVFVAMCLRFGWNAVLTASDPELVQWQANFGPFTLRDEWWRVWSSLFVHANIVHLVMNCVAFWVIGSIVEKLIGSAKMFCLFLLAGTVGAVTTLIINPTVLSCGMSGAIFGTFGALIAFYQVHNRDIPLDTIRARIPALLLFIGGSLLYGLFDTSMDSWSHAGGFIGGYVAGLALVNRGLSRVTRWSRKNTIGAFALLMFGLFALIAADCLTENRVDVSEEEGKMMADLGQADKSIKYISHLIKQKPSAALYFARAYDYWKLNNPAQCIRDTSSAIDLDPRYLKAYLLRAASYGELSKHSLAHADLDRAVAIDPSNEDAHTLRAMSLVALERYNEAISDCDSAIKRNQSNVRAYIARASAYCKLGNYKQSVSDCNHAYRLAPGSLKTCGVIAAQAHEGEGDYKKALEEYNKVISEFPTATGALIGRGWLTMGLSTNNDELQTSIDDFSKAMKLDPHVGDSYFGLASVYFVQRRFSESEVMARKAIEVYSWDEPKQALYATYLAAASAKFQDDDGTRQELLVEALKHAKGNAWPGPIAHYLVGDVTQQEVEKGLSLSKLTEARAYQAIDRLAGGKSAEASAQLVWVRDRGNKTYCEQKLADALLNRPKEWHI